MASDPNNSAGFAAINAQIAKLRKVAGMTERAAPAVARGLDSEIRTQIARGVAPDGTPWQLTEKGEVPLRNAGAGLEVTSHGTVIVATLTGNAVRHHLGTARGRIRRQVLPSSKLSQPVIRTIDRVLRGEFNKAFK